MNGGEGCLMVGIVVTGLVLFVSVIVLAVMIPMYYVDKSRCGAFGQQTNREVKFVKFNLVTWDCLTRTADGKWISTDALREFGEKP